MAKRGSSSFSATKVAKTGMVIGKLVEKLLAMEKEIGRLRHHVSVLSRRNHVLSGGKKKVTERKGKEEVAESMAGAGVADCGVADPEVVAHDEAAVAKVVEAADLGRVAERMAEGVAHGLSCGVGEVGVEWEVASVRESISNSIAMDSEQESSVFEEEEDMVVGGKIVVRMPGDRKRRVLDSGNRSVDSGGSGPLVVPLGPMSYGRGLGVLGDSGGHPLQMAQVIPRGPRLGDRAASGLSAGSVRTNPNLMGVSGGSDGRRQSPVVGGVSFSLPPVALYAEVWPEHDISSRTCDEQSKTRVDVWERIFGWTGRGTRKGDGGLGWCISTILHLMAGERKALPLIVLCGARENGRGLDPVVG
ncbi:hypothetical protein B9Z19DRAFT_1119287 [Tuber borchii]|uniref:Uncharacterized protein n=1 Tax=Tuber borchii TaxID=42251 RepID=A0A2T7A6S6_TUBBO|nr:hypothetical protein B9Z19DRAFT_1119287 [Tuber borchii]